VLDCWQCSKPVCAVYLLCAQLQAEQLISEFTLTSPAMYDKEPEKHPGVKHLGDMLVCMAESPSLAKVTHEGASSSALWTMVYWL